MHNMHSLASIPARALKTAKKIGVHFLLIFQAISSLSSFDQKFRSRSSDSVLELSSGFIFRLPFIALKSALLPPDCITRRSGRALKRAFDNLYPFSGFRLFE